MHHSSQQIAGQHLPYMMIHSGRKRWIKLSVVCKETMASKDSLEMGTEQC